MKRYATLTAFVALVTAAAASCGDNPTSPASNVAQRTAPADASAQRVPDNGNGISKHAAERAALLTSVPVTGTLSDGGSFVGSFTATHISIDPATRALTMTGTLVGTATTVSGADRTGGWRPPSRRLPTIVPRRSPPPTAQPCSSRAV